MRLLKLAAHRDICLAAVPAATSLRFHFQLGICYKELCLYAEAIACYEQAVATGPPTCVARENLSVAKCDLGTRHKLEGRTDVAAACYAEALALNPNYYPALFNLGVIYSEQGDMERALESYMAAVAKNPNYCEALCNVGVIHKNSGRLEMAIEYYSRALKSNPNFAIAASNLSIAKTGKQRTKIACCSGWRWFLCLASVCRPSSHVCFC